jgi:hypothetical protein
MVAGSAKTEHRCHALRRELQPAHICQTSKTLVMADEDLCGRQRGNRRRVGEGPRLLCRETWG